MGRIPPRLVAAVALLAVVATLAIQNHENVTLDVLFWSVSMPRSLLVVLLVAAGFVAGWLVTAWRRRRSA